MKKLSETYKKLGIDFTFPIEIRGANGYVTYYENSDDFWERCEWDANGNLTCYEDSDGDWYRYERDADGNETYFENSEGVKRSRYYKPQPIIIL